MRAFCRRRRKDFNTARRQYVELYGSVAVMNTYLKIAVFCLSIVTVGLIVAQVKTIQLFRGFRPLVIRVNELGRAEAVAYSSLEYLPQEGEIKYFLIRFVEQHYGRIRATVQQDYARSLYFLDGRVADAPHRRDQEEQADRDIPGRAGRLKSKFASRAWPLKTCGVSLTAPPLTSKGLPLRFHAS